MPTEALSLPVLATGLAVAVAASFLGVFVILRRMALVSDALSHVALPGLGLALLWHRDPFVGALVFLLAAVWAVYVLERRTRLAAESIVGVLFTTALALGALVTPSESLLEGLFGDISKLRPSDAWVALAGSALVVATLLLFFRPIARTTLAPDLARSEGVPVGLAEGTYLVLLALTVAIGIKVIGTLLMGALIILPAATAKNICADLRAMVGAAVAVGVAATAGGLSLAAARHWPPGPPVVLTSALIFLLTLLRARRAL